MTRRLNIVPRAEQDAQIFDWIAERSPDGANRWFAAFEHATKEVAQGSRPYGLAPEGQHVTYELRQFLFKTSHGRIYRGVFTVVGDEVRVLRIRGPGQPPLTADELGE